VLVDTVRKVPKVPLGVPAEVSAAHDAVETLSKSSADAAATGKERQA
jgi:hypothetical protein